MTIEAKIDRTNVLLETLIEVMGGTAPEKRKPGRPPEPEKKNSSGADDIDTGPAKPEPKPRGRKPKKGEETVSDEDLFGAGKGKQDAEAPPAETPLTRDQVKDKLVQFRNAKGKEALNDLLQAFDADALSKLAPANYAAIVARADEIMADEGGDDDGL